ncbi:MAG: transporter [Propionibacteriaceae bacterium]|nr:transporter [Propionibacteriaceae bacterium]
MFEFLAAQPILLLVALVLLGSALGSVKLAGFSLGPAAVLFVALALTAVGVAHGVELAVPEVVGNFGLALFTYTVGVSSGPNFFGSLRRGWPTMLSVAGCLVLAAAVAALAGRLMGLSSAVVAGTFAGGLTNTPALAAAGQAAGQAEEPALGYSISYLGGVIGMLLAAAWALARGGKNRQRRPRLEQRTVRIDQADGSSIAELQERHRGEISFSRVRHDEDPEHTVVAVPDERLRRGDLVSVVGPAELLDAITAELGHTSSHDLVGEQTHLDYNRVTVSKQALLGLRLVDLGLPERFGAQVSRVRRGDVDLVATPDFVVQSGDRLRVVAPSDQMRAVRSYLGDSERGFSDINPTGLALGLTCGVLIGLVHIPLPGGGFALGSAVGTLVVGLVFGRIGRVGPVVTSMATASANSLSSLGMLIFLAYAGTKAGAGFSAAITSDLGWRVILLGLAITATAAVALLVVGRWPRRLPWPQVAGQLGGAQTQPAVLAFANERTEFDPQVGLGYALVYPAAMVAKILLAQALVILG